MFKDIGGGGTIVTGAASINLVRMTALKGMLRLELVGMKRRGQSVYSIIKREYNFKGNKQKVFDQFCKLIVETAAAHNNAE
jgi:uncharacterized protein (DUF2141 family)